MRYHIPLHLPNDVFHALTEHTGEGWYGPKTEAALSELIRNTAAAPMPAVENFRAHVDFLCHRSSSAWSPP